MADSRGAPIDRVAGRLEPAKARPEGWWDGSAAGQLRRLEARVAEFEAENAGLREKLRSGGEGR